MRNQKLTYRSTLITFTLSTLFIGITLAAVVLGRISYLKQWKDYHRQEAARLLITLERRYHWSKDDIDTLLTPPPSQKCDLWDFCNHRQLEAEYEAAMFRPWKCVKERHSPDE